MKTFQIVRLAFLPFALVACAGASASIPVGKLTTPTGQKGQPMVQTFKKPITSGPVVTNAITLEYGADFMPQAQSIQQCILSSDGPLHKGQISLVIPYTPAATSTFNDLLTDTEIGRRTPRALSLIVHDASGAVVAQLVFGNSALHTIQLPNFLGPDSAHPTITVTFDIWGWFRISDHLVG